MTAYTLRTSWIWPERRRTSHPEIPWFEITGMRSKIVHDYMDVDEDVVWEVVTQDLPHLIAALEKIVPPEDAE
ncbi:MAG: HepT-like ribonuclease domain-containing protein [Anaerolineae bacterium]